MALLPDVRGRFDLVRTATTDASGRFRLDRVIPGDYKVFAWNEVGDGDWQDPDLMRAFEERGAPIHIREGATERVGLTTIMAQ